MSKKINIKGKKSIFLTILLTITSLLLIFSMANKIQTRMDRERIDINKPPDLLMYYTGAKVVKDYGIKNLYDTSIQSEIQKKIAGVEDMEGLLAFRAPPLTAYLLSPLADLTYAKAFMVSIVINLFLSALIITIYYKINTIEKRVWFYLLLALPLYIPIWSNFNHGQISLLILLVISLTYYLLTNNRMLPAGLAIGLVLLKPQFLTIIPMLLVLCSKAKKIKELLLGTVLSLLSLTLANIFLYGTKFLTEYPRYLLASESESYGTNVLINYNLSSAISLFVSDINHVKLLNIIINTALYLLLIFILWKKNRQINKDLAFAAIVLFTPLINLHTMPVDIVVFHLPLYIVTSYFYRNRDFKQMYRFAFLMFLISWSGFVFLQYGTTLVYFILGFWILRLSFAQGEEIGIYSNT